MNLADHYRTADAGAQTSPPHQQDVLESLLRRALCGREAQTALDLGSGRGANLDTLSRHARHVVAADVSEQALTESRSRWSGSPEALTSVVLPGDGLPFRDGAFDLSVCTEVLEHVSDPVGTGSELERVTARGGHLVISTPNYWNVMGLVKLWHDRRSGKQDWDPWHAHEGGLERFMTPARVQHLFPRCKGIESRGADYASALGLVWSPIRRRLNRHLLLGPGSGPLRHFGMQHYLLLKRQ